MSGELPLLKEVVSCCHTAGDIGRRQQPPILCVFRQSQRFIAELLCLVSMNGYIHLFAELLFDFGVFRIELAACPFRQLYLECDPFRGRAAALLRIGLRGFADIPPQTAWSRDVSPACRNFLCRAGCRDLYGAGSRREPERIVDPARHRRSGHAELAAGPQSAHGRNTRSLILVLSVVKLLGYAVP